MSDRTLLRQLRGVTRQIYSQPELLAEWSTDASVSSNYAGIDPRELPAFAVVPETAGDVSEVIRIAMAADRRVIVRGGGTNRVGALFPVEGAIVIATHGLNVIEPVDEVNGTIRVDAGVTVHELEERLAEVGYTLGHSPGSFHHATVGGQIATGSAGLFATKYGGIGELLVGIDVVLADGTLVSSPVMPGTATGPHWPRLFTGSEGALGIITAATLIVRPIPECRTYRAFDLPSLKGAAATIRTLVGRGVTPATVRLYDEQGSRSCREEWGAPEAVNLVLLIFEGPAALVEVEEALTATALMAAGGRDLGPEPAALWFAHLRGSSYEDDGYDASDDDSDVDDGTAITGEIDIAAPWSALVAVIEAGRAALSQLPLDCSVAIAHPRRTGAMVGFNLSTRDEPDVEAVTIWDHAVTLLTAAVSAAGGGVTYHNGIGRERQPALGRQPHASTAVLAAVLQALDPGGRFVAPGWRHLR